ncbi:MAG: Rieske 2Fe-2S domain-containing protein [Chloroflexi bacterium]|nr:Rieske 2Fe-2S domain-containing protein [Chloroflexota bacterium]
MQTEVVERLIARQDWLDRAGDPLQRVVQRVLGKGPRAQVVRDALHGVWLGHPLHPALTDVPMGAWTVALLLDLASLGRRGERWQRGADASLALGLAGALGSAATGLADWSWTYGQTRKTGLVHALFNTLATLLYSGSLARRLSGRREGAVTLSVAGYLCVLGGAYLGGELVYRLGMAVNRNAWVEGPPDFRPALREADLAEGKPTKVVVDGVDVLLVRQRGALYALEQTCGHEGGPLAEGELSDGCITCPWHGSQYRLVDGSLVHGPATAPQPCFDVRVREGMIEVRRALA